MPYPGVPDSDTEKMERCVGHVMDKGHDKSSAIAICHSAIVGKSEESVKALLDMGFKLDAEPSAKFSIKVAGDWELEVNGNPFGPDSDTQWFDKKTKIVSGSEIPVVYYHSLSEDSRIGNIKFADKPIIIGKASMLEVRSDGVWWKVLLDKTVDKAKDVWEAAKKHAAVASSGCINYLSRLEVGGKLVPYTKSIPGRIAIWHMGELSLWDKFGHLPQAHPSAIAVPAHAVAVPALKAIYEAAKMPFPPSIVSPKNAESSMSEERKGELEELQNFVKEYEKYIERF